MVRIQIRDNEMPEPNEGNKILSFENGVDTHHMLTLVEDLKEHRNRLGWLASYYTYDGTARLFVNFESSTVKVDFVPLKKTLEVKRPEKMEPIEVIRYKEGQMLCKLQQISELKEEVNGIKAELQEYYRQYNEGELKLQTT